MPKRQAGGKKRAIERLGIGVLIPGTSTPIQAGDRLWRFGLASTEAGQEALFICLCDWREFIVQSVVASLGRAMDLPVPPCYVVAANSNSFPELQAEGNCWLFACRAGAHPTLTAFAQRIGHAADMVISLKRETTNRLIVLDEWALNARRDDTAAMVDPGAGLLLVDHHPSLPPSAGPGDQLRNWVHEIIHADKMDLDQLRLRKEMERSAGNLFDIDLGVLADQAPMFCDEKQQETWLGILDHLSNRRHHLENLFCARIGLPEQQLAFPL